MHSSARRMKGGRKTEMNESQKSKPSNVSNTTCDFICFFQESLGNEIGCKGSSNTIQIVVPYSNGKTSMLWSVPSVIVMTSSRNSIMLSSNRDALALGGWEGDGEKVHKSQKSETSIFVSLAAFQDIY